MRDSGYQRVHTVTKYYDGPREGIADFDGRPHAYEAQFDEETDEYTDIFLLSPVPTRLFELAVESWSIWGRKSSAAEPRG